MRKYLAGGLRLTDSERSDAQRMLEIMKAHTTEGPTTERERFGLLSKMLLAYPIANASEAVGKARGEAYRDALEGLPAWAVDKAVKRWNRGECGDQHDYRWAPAPAILRRIASKEIEEYRRAQIDLTDLLEAVPLEETPSDPAERTRVAEGFRKLSARLKDGPVEQPAAPIDHPEEAAA